MFACLFNERWALGIDTAFHIEALKEVLLRPSHWRVVRAEVNLLNHCQSVTIRPPFRYCKVFLTNKITHRDCSSSYLTY